MCASANGRSASSPCRASSCWTARSASGSTRPAKGFLVTISVRIAPTPFCFVAQRLRTSPTSFRRASGSRAWKAVTQRHSNGTSCRPSHVSGEGEPNERTSTVATCRPSIESDGDVCHSAHASWGASSPVGNDAGPGRKVTFANR